MRTVVKSLGAHVEITETPNRFLVVAEEADRTHRLEIVARPSIARAKALVRTVRQFHHVELCRSVDGWTAVAHVTGHRLPRRQAVRIGTAIALALHGHAITVCRHTIDGEPDGPCS